MGQINICLFIFVNLVVYISVMIIVGVILMTVLFNSPGFLRLVDVLVEMSMRERKAFLQFATGCSSLPPGGLANLHPRLTVVRKVIITCTQSFYPYSTNIRDRKTKARTWTLIIKEGSLCCEKNQSVYTWSPVLRNFRNLQA